ncbi:MAG: DUF655 domain-containing protein [Desulfurococcaceae archaeon]
MYRRSSPTKPHHREGYRLEPYVYVLDYLELGNPSDVHYEHRNQPFVQAIGGKYFTLLEAMPLIGIKIDILERVDLSYPSKLRRILHVSYNDLTSVARSNLPEALKRIIIENEKIFVEFYNIAEPINIRLHSLELLPDIGKKTMNILLEERMKRRFTSLGELRERVGIDPVKPIVERVIKEMSMEEKYYLFVKPRERGQIYLAYLERLHGEIF